MIMMRHSVWTTIHAWVLFKIQSFDQFNPPPPPPPPIASDFRHLLNCGTITVITHEASGAYLIVWRLSEQIMAKVMQ